MTTLSHDLRFVGRLIARTPVFYALLVGTLALGIGANVAIFTVANGVLFEPLPFDDPDDLVALWESNVAEGRDREKVAPPNFADYLEVFDNAAAWWTFDVNLTDTAGTDPLRVSTVECTANLFAVLGVEPLLGAGFGADTTAIFNPDRAAIISHRLWQSRYSGSSEILGRTVTLNGNAYTIAGVMPRDFAFPGPDVDVWQRQTWEPSRRTRYAHFLEVIGRIPSGSTVGETQTRLTTVSQRLAQEHPPSNGDWTAVLVPLHTELVGDYRHALLVLLGAVSLLLLLAAVNVTNLLLARYRSRQQEIAIRAAVGASPIRLLRLTFTEFAIIAVMAALAGALLAALLVRLLVAAQPLPVPRLSSVAFDGTALLFAAALTILTAAIFAALPAIRVVRQSVRPLFGRQNGAARRYNRRLLVVVETALAMALLVGAGLMIRSVRSMLAIDSGFQSDRTVTMTLELPAAVYPEWPQVSQIYHRLLEQVRAHPSIHHAGAAGFLPLSPGWIVPFTLPDRPSAPEDETLRAQYVTTSSGYFKSLGIALLHGRTFSNSDREDSPPVVVINEALARRTWPQTEDAVGQKLRAGTSGFGPLGRSFAPTGVYEIVGVVASFRNTGLLASPDPAIYFTVRQFPYRTMAVVAQGNGDSALTADVIREALQGIDPTLPLTGHVSVQDLLDKEIARPRFVMSLLIVFASLAILLSALGIYGVLSYSVTERRKEIAIRRCIGASRRRVRSQILLEGIALAAAGVITGSLLAMAVSRMMSGVLFQISSTDPNTFVLAILTVTGTALAAATLPAYRAAEARPVDSLRLE